MRVNVTMLRAARAIRRRRLQAALPVAACLVVLPAAAGAQGGLTHADAVAPVPRGMVRLSATPSWLRYDSRFTAAGGTEPLGAVLTSDTLGSVQLPALRTYESALQSLTGNPSLRLSFGRAFAAASVRVVTTPVTLEYGLTRRLSLGVTVPIVQRQRELLLDITATGDSAGNIGPVGSAVRPQMHAQASRLAEAIEGAAAALQQRITQCAATPAAAECAAVRADPAGAAATLFEGNQVAASVRYIYGVDAASPGAIGLVPRAELTAGIDARLEALNTRFATYLGGTPLSTRTAPAGSLGAATAADLRALTRSGTLGLGPDSLARVSKIGIGDVEVGARLLLWDTRAPRTVADTVDAARGARVRILLGALARLGTGMPASDDELFVPGSGDGQTDAEGSIAADVEGIGRFGATLLARYTAQLGTVAATRLPEEDGRLAPFGARGIGTRTLGSIVTVEVSPRYRLGNSLYLAGHYAFRSRGDDRYEFPVAGVVDPLPFLVPRPGLPATATVEGHTEQRAGIGLSYSTYAEWERGAVRIPIEVSYTHLETFSGSNAMVPRAGRDQVQVRLYYRVRR